MQETRPTVYRPYPGRLESVTYYRCHSKGSTFSSVNFLCFCVGPDDSLVPIQLSNQRSRGHLEAREKVAFLSRSRKESLVADLSASSKFCFLHRLVYSSIFNDWEGMVTVGTIYYD